MDTSWHIQLFGALRAQREDLVITRFASSRIATLLAWLVLAPPRSHPRQELIDLLWPDVDAEAGRLRLRVAMASLRRQLEPPDVAPGSVLLADRLHLRLAPQACRCDVHDFEAALKAARRAPSPPEKRDALDQALALYSGELLPGFYDDWIIEERERLTALYEEACDERELLPPADSSPHSSSAHSPLAEGTDGLPAAPHGLPLPFTRFFGREPECAKLAEWLRDPHTRLVTLTGPGGTGKTRLAVQTARQAAGRLDGAVWFVPLADLNEATLIADAIALALGLTRAADQEPLDQVASFLATQPPTLLALDNFEHLVTPGAPLVFSLLSRLPTLTCLVTSRRRLGLPGEREFPVSALPLPGPDETLERMSQAASIQLFVDRAQHARPDFQLTRGNASAVAALCRSLEGLPLAIELVAARAQALTLAQMTERLAQRFEFLTSRRGDKGGRHRSLWAAMSWSYDLLAPELQRFFAGLSVFRGGCTLEAAEAVCGTDRQALEFLTQLGERSLLVASERGREMRFRLLESLREFAQEHLSPDERRSLACRHAAYFAGQASSLAALWSGPNQSVALDTLDAELDNLRAALAFCASEMPDADAPDDWNGAETGLRLAGALGCYWTTRGLLREGLGWLEAALAAPGADKESVRPSRARALSEAGWMAAGLGSHEQADDWLAQAVTLFRPLSDRSALASALRRRGVAGLWRGDYPHAELYLKEALALSRDGGDPAAIAGVLNSLGVLAEEGHGDQVRARALYEEALALFRACGDRQWMSYCLHNLGNIAHHFGDQAQAETWLLESLALAESLGDEWQRAYCLRSLGDTAAARGDLADAAQALEEGLALCRRLGDRMTEGGTLCSLASVARRQADMARAEGLYADALGLYQDMNRAMGVALCGISLAELAASQSRWERAACLLSAVEASQEAPLLDELRARFDAAHQAALTSLGTAAFQTAWERGRVLSWDECLAPAPP